MPRAGGVPAPRLFAHLRYEVVPLAGAGEQVRHLTPGTTVAITSSPSRGLEPTIELAEQLGRAGYDAVPHLAARSVRSDVQLKEIVDRLEAAGVRDVLVIAGDNPEPAGPYADGIELLTALGEQEHPFTGVGVPAYPEGHPLLDDETLWRSLARKQGQASYIVTQLCFNAAALARWLTALNERGIGLPVYIGVPGVVERRKLLRMAARLGVRDAQRFIRKHARLALPLLRRGDYRPDRLVRALARQLPPDADVRGLHLYTFNAVQATVEWVREGER